MEARDWDRLAGLLAPEFVCAWPQSGERFDRAGYVEVNRRYPGEWHLRLVRVVDGGEWVATEVEVTLTDERGQRTDTALSFFRVVEGAIVELREFWPEPFAPPVWRRELSR